MVGNIKKMKILNKLFNKLNESLRKHTQEHLELKEIAVIFIVLILIGTFFTGYYIGKKKGMELDPLLDVEYFMNHLDEITYFTNVLNENMSIKEAVGYYNRYKPVSQYALRLAIGSVCR